MERDVKVAIAGVNHPVCMSETDALRWREVEKATKLLCRLRVYHDEDGEPVEAGEAMRGRKRKERGVERGDRGRGEKEERKEVEAVWVCGVPMTFKEHLASIVPVLFSFSVCPSLFKDLFSPPFQSSRESLQRSNRYFFRFLLFFHFLF